MCGRQGQPAAGTVAGGDKDRAGQRMCGAATGRGDNRGNRIRTGRDVVCTGGWRGAAAGEARAAYDAICGAGRRWHAVRRPHACAVAGNPDGWRDPKAGAGGPGGVDSERRCGRGGMVPGIRGSRGGRCARTGPVTGGAVVSFVESALGKTAPPRHGFGGRGGTW